MTDFYESLEELKPCPFCGGEAGIARIGNSHTKKYVAEIGCKTRGCTAAIRVGSPKGYATTEWVEQKAIEKWNSRIGDESND